MANPFNTLHIFGFGTVQVITDTQNVQASVSDFQALVDACVDDVWANKPEGYTGPKQYHAINTFYDLFSDWLPNQPDAQSFRVQYADLDTTAFVDLAEAVLAGSTTTTTTTTSAPATTSTTTTSK